LYYSLFRQVYVTYRDDENLDGFECQLIDLPNWGFSYALALFRVHESNPTEEAKKKADDAIQLALCRFPSVVGQILEKNEINVRSRSFQTDWPSVIGFVDILVRNAQNTLSDAAKSDPVIRACTTQAYETIVRIFVHQNFKLWSSGSVLNWVYDNLEILKDKYVGENESLAVSLSPAFMRFARCDPADYDDKFQTMPVDANPLDRNIVAHALIVDVNRPRLLQRMPRGGADVFDEPEIAFGAGNGLVIGGPPTREIDPDLPLLEVFWRSALPWNRVEGVPPPAR
jgi:Transcriptional repressor TCF25